MKLGILADMLQELRDADTAIEDCREALKHGGNKDTMDWKQNNLDDALKNYRELFNKEITL